MAGIKSVWNNPFYKNFKPIPKWAYVVDFNGFILHNDPAIQHEMIDSYADLLSQAIIKHKFGKREISIVKSYYAGIEANNPGRVANCGELDLMFNEDQEMRVSKCLDEIFNGECSNDEYFEGKGAYIGNVKSGFNKTDRSITLTILKPRPQMSSEITEPEYQVAGKYTFHNCILTIINEEEMDYDDKEGIVTRTARISYDWMYDHRARKRV